jgi:AcrR family transcriptional regulator
MHGPGVGMDEIASAAGVAVGTLYRHFPTKTDLVAAVVSAYMKEVADRTELAARRVEEGRPAYVELSGLFREIVTAAASNHAVKVAAITLNANVDDSLDMKRAGRALDSLVNAAKVEGSVREDLSVNDFYLLVSNAPTGETTDVLNRWIDLTLFGIAGPPPR